LDWMNVLVPKAFRGDVSPERTHSDQVGDDIDAEVSNGRLTRFWTVPIVTLEERHRVNSTRG